MATGETVTAPPSPPPVAESEANRIRSGAAGLHRIVVVGGGAGGLELVTRLGNKLGRRRRAEIVLIDKSRTCLLYTSDAADE